MKFLKPIYPPHSDFDLIESKIIQLFKEEFYYPLLKEMKEPPRKTLQNSEQDDLLDAIHSGRITYNRGHFRGRFNSTLSRALRNLGARWDRKQGSYAIPLSKLPLEVSQTIALSYSKFEQTANKIVQKLKSFIPEKIADKLNLTKIFDSTLYKTDREVSKSLKASITINAPTFNDVQRAKIAEEYTNNMQLDIKGWMDSEIIELRKKVEDYTKTGQRHNGGLAKLIKDSYGVSTRKAKFLARQETNLLVTKYKETRYKSAGVNHYKWQCVIGAPKHPVRPLHKKNDQKIFTWDNPPLVSESPARYENPGEDYNCRCIAIPIVNFEKK